MLRWLGVIATALLLTTLALLWLAPTLLPWAQLETRVAGVLAQRTGAMVDIKELRGELLPSPWLEAVRVEIGLQPRVYAEGVRADLELWPLLRGGIVATSLRIEQFSAEPGQIPALLLREQISDNGQPQRDSALQEVHIDALELYPGQASWRARFKRARGGWEFTQQRDEVQVSGWWQPDQHRIELQLLPGGDHGTAWRLPDEVRLSADIQTFGLDIGELEAVWPDHTLTGSGVVRFDADERWRIEELEVQVQGERIQIAPGVLLNGQATARLFVDGHLDLPMTGGVVVERLRVQLDRLSGTLSGSGLTALLPPIGSEQSLQVQSLQAIADWRDGQLSVRRLRIEADALSLQGYVVVDANQGLRGELGLFPATGRGRSWRAGGSVLQPTWVPGPLIP